MSLLIGCMLIYHFDLGWWWYALSAAWYYAEWDMHHKYYDKLRIQIDELRDAVRNPQDLDD